MDAQTGLFVQSDFDMHSLDTPGDRFYHDTFVCLCYIFMWLTAM